jgi:alpha-tubulin suppressor-like RCC1 family protein
VDEGSPKDVVGEGTVDSSQSALTVTSQVQAGSWLTCNLTSNGGVKCWGDNSKGQLGDGTTTTRLTPVNVSGLSSGVAAITAGGSHACALTTGGAVKCWGYNANGQLGDGTTTNRLTPVNVSGLSSGVTAISAGEYHTCALTTGGAVKCWGNNANGQLGNGTTTNGLTPVNVSGLSSGAAGISLGVTHTCAWTTGGAVKCWGSNANGQLGDGTTTNRLTPVSVSGLASGVTAISAGDFASCAVTGGAAKCWGLNAYGQLGDGTTTTRLTPVNVSGLSSGVAAISAGGSHACVVTTGGAAKCWGGNGFGQVGNGTTTTRLTPMGVLGLSSGVAKISAGQYHTCASLSTGGTVKCWGKNAQGVLGDGTTTNKLTPVFVVGIGDPTPPTVNLTAPGAGTVSGIVTISASASDNIGVTKVEFYTDGVLLATDTTSPYSVSWDTKPVTAGSHSLYVRAYDAAGNNSTTAPITVTVVKLTVNAL